MSTVVLTSKSVLFNNKLNNFKCRISPPLQFKQKTSVQLTKIALPYVISLGNSSIETIIDDVSTIFKIPQAYFGDIDELLAFIKGLKIPGLAIKRKLDRIIVSTANKFIFHGELFKVLGLFLENTGTVQSLLPPDINRSIKPVLIHCDLIKPRLFGESRRTILCALYDINDYVVSSPDICYVQGTEVHEIQFEITDIDNNPINFHGGEVVLTLHFEKCNLD